MKSICLCFKINIPPIRLNYRFFNINRNHKYFNTSHVAHRVHKICQNSLMPFFECLLKVADESQGKFKIAISISGTSLTQIHAYAPKLLSLLFELNRNNCVEFLSEPWSHSLLPYYNPKLLSQQIVLHDKQVNFLFQSTPQIFLNPSPGCSKKLVKILYDCGKKGILSYVNCNKKAGVQHIDTKYFGDNLEPPVLLINYKLSQLLYEIDINEWEKPVEAVSATIFKRIKLYTSQEEALAVLYNPTASKSPFHLKRVATWAILLKQMLNHPEYVFTFPSEIIRQKSSVSMLLNNSETAITAAKQPNIWLNSRLQKEAFKRQEALSKLVETSENRAINNDWNFIQDMGYLFYMNTKFTKKKYAGMYYNPFNGPYMAFINYMNVLDDFEGRLHNTKSRYTEKSPAKQILNRENFLNN